MSNRLAGESKRKRHAVLRVSVDSVRVQRPHEACNRFRPLLAGIAGSLVPHHDREELANAAAMKVGDHLLYARDSARHGTNHFLLIAVVDSHIWIGRPN